MNGINLSNRQFLTPSEVAKVFRVSKSNIYQMLRSGELPETFVRKVKRIPVKAVLEILDGKHKESLK
ncbi:MAG: helix-turn-helix domain-containing protein [Nitrospirae bacterium]|nr:helix-turn-helix domain-containing protein [Nitrospirota bacterium]